VTRLKCCDVGDIAPGCQELLIDLIVQLNDCSLISTLWTWAVHNTAS